MSERGTLQPGSIAGKIRAAMDRVGWDTDVQVVASAVGKVRQGTSVWNSRKQRWDTKWIDELPSPDYINAVRRKFWFMRLPTRRVLRRTVVVATPESEFCRIAAGLL